MMLFLAGRLQGNPRVFMRPRIGWLHGAPQADENHLPLLRLPRFLSPVMSPPHLSQFAPPAGFDQCVVIHGLWTQPLFLGDACIIFSNAAFQYYEMG
jgi:hypothetical protein